MIISGMMLTSNSIDSKAVQQGQIMKITLKKDYHLARHPKKEIKSMLVPLKNKRYKQK